MASRDRGRPWRVHLVRGLGASTRHNGLAYGYSLALTGTFGMLAALAPPVDPPRILAFGVGGSLTFMLANAALTGGFRRRVRDEPPLVRVLASSLSVISITGALGWAWLVGWAVPAWPAWLLGPFAASSVYLGLSAFELAFARQLRPLLGVDELEEIDDDEDDEPV